jgi:hypothetical protein
MTKRTLAIAVSIAGMSFAAAPIASAATASHGPVKTERVERTHDARADRTGHDRSTDKASRDRPTDKASRDRSHDSPSPDIRDR